jgi:hypothetical protein
VKEEAQANLVAGSGSSSTASPNYSQPGQIVTSGLPAKAAHAGPPKLPHMPHVERRRGGERTVLFQNAPSLLSYSKRQERGLDRVARHSFLWLIVVRVDGRRE